MIIERPYKFLYCHCIKIECIKTDMSFKLNKNKLMLKTKSTYSWELIDKVNLDM